MKAQNKAGTWFTLVEKDNGNFLVYKLCSNYNGNVHGGISKNWRAISPNTRATNTEFQKMVREGMPKAEAETLFSKKLKGKQK